jgi:processive 1,2-diacylglycerol beta-glucosyltransferase
MAKIMHAAHLVVGKPGGLTVSEALAAGCAFVVHEPFLIPGQEEDNARFLVERKIGLVTHDNKELGDTVRRIFESRDEVVKMRANALYAGMPGSAMQIATKVLELATLDTVAAS